MQHRITIEETGEQYACGAQESLLIAMARSGRRGIPLGCRGGGCGVCKIEITRGSFETGAMSRQHVSDEDRAGDRLLACRVYPRGDVSVRVLGRMHRAVCTAAGIRPETNTTKRD
ncbi:MAG: 2Fe-2S iron-sulfur cluster binding domain-containing protein [Rhodocyclaceae bacterium]|nr:2Fe-2S iron-sulfur cluster binding domain-containing protein [Rhodocyclaceae bacterium]